MTDTKHPLQIALENIQFNCEEEFKIRSYSGRRMYGKNCLAINGDNLNMAVIGYLIGRNAVEEHEYDPRAETVGDTDLMRMRSDSMGLGEIYYWPDIPYVGNDDEDEETYDDE